MRKWATRAALGGIAAGLVITAQGVPAAAATAPANAGQPRATTLGCSTWHGAVAGYTGWATSKSDCGFITSTSPKATQYKTYSWAIQAGSNGRICVQAQGHTWSKAKKKMVTRWYKAGCGDHGLVVVPWHAKPYKKGYVGLAGMPKVRAKLQPGFLGGGYKWS